MSRERIEELIRSLREQMKADHKMKWSSLNELHELVGRYIGRLKIAHPAYIEMVQEIEKSADNYYLDISKQTALYEKLRVIDLWTGKIVQLIEIGESLEKEREKFLPDYRELTNEIKKIRDDYDMMDGLFEEFKNMKNDLKEIVKEYKESKKGR